MFEIEHANDSDSDVAIEKVVASENSDEILRDSKSIEVKKELLKEASEKGKKTTSNKKVSSSVKSSPRKMRKRST